MQGNKLSFCGKVKKLKKVENFNISKKVSKIKKVTAFLTVSALFFGAIGYAAEIPSLPQQVEGEFSSAISLPVDEFLTGDLVYVNISSKPQASAYGFEAVIDYDKDMLEYKAVDGLSVGDEGISRITEKDGKIIIIMSRVGGYEIKEDDLGNDDSDNVEDSENNNNNNNVNNEDNNSEDNNSQDINNKVLNSVANNQNNNPKNIFCRIVFSAKKDGKTEVKLSSLKTVFKDLTYFSEENSNISVSVNITDPNQKDEDEKENNKKPGGSSGGGGGGISFGGGVSSVGKPSPNIKNDEDTVDSNQNNDDINNKDNNSENSSIFFSDLDKNYWAYESIVKMAKKGIINGFNDGTFKPEDYITRAEFSKLLFGIGGFRDMDLDSDYENKNLSDIEFSDVSTDDWFYKEVGTLAKIGIINGSDGLFFPNDNISRQDAALMVKRFVDYKNISIGSDEADKTDTIKTFSDGDSISDYAFEAVNYLSKGGILTGDENNRFNPNSNMIRAEAAAMLFRVYNLLSLDN